jgi:exodeoxyribonuclease V alpha subunit
MNDDFAARTEPFLAAGVLAPADVHAVALTAPRFGESDPIRMLGLAFAVRAPRVGHAGVDLATVALRIDDEEVRAEEGSEPSLPWPDPATWMKATLGSPMVGPPDRRDRPFVRQLLDSGSLLLTRRIYREQERVAAALRHRAVAVVADRARIAELDRTIARLFGDDPTSEAARAVRLAAARRLALVVGGPGTGKTFSITRLLAAVLAGRDDDRPVVALAAPTGKAAVRMREAILEATSPEATPWLDIDDRLRSTLRALESKTLHRLLGMRPDGSSRHDARNPLPADLVVVDEVSMVDLGLMRHLLEAISPEARLVLLGDRDQLPSVEAGSVLADLVGDRSTGPLAGSLQLFTESRRFADAPDVALVAGCLQSYATSVTGLPAEAAERLVRALDVFCGRAHAPGERHPGSRLSWLGPPDRPGEHWPARPTEAQLDALAAPYTKGFAWLDPAGGVRAVEGYAQLLRRHAGSLHDQARQRELLGALERYRVLAVHRRGPLGVADLNRAIARQVRQFLGHRGAGGRHWVGLPILVTENSYEVGLMNGDVGLVLSVSGNGEAVFPTERPEQVRRVALSRLPPHEPALAMTVHKAQGSQFDRVALVLAGRPSPIQTRELVYTGVTRARNQLAWLGDEAELHEALGRRVARASGLEALLGEDEPGLPGSARGS